jgi:hypothetical protein
MLQMQLNEANPLYPLSVVDADGAIHESVCPVRAFPIQAPDEGIALMDQSGKEVMWIEMLCDLPDDQRQYVNRALDMREFMPEIKQIVSVTSYATPCTWRVATHKGVCDFVLRGEEDIRHLSTDMLMLTDTHGIHFLIRSMTQLGAASRKILDRFL